MPTAVRRPRPLTPARIVALVLGLLLLTASVVQVTLALVSALYRTTVTEEVAIAQPVGSFAVEARSGDVDVTASTDGRLRVQVEKRFGLREPEIRQEQSAEGLRLSSACEAYEPSCSVTFRIALPAGMDVEVSNGAGDVNVSGATGALSLDTGSGDISVSGAAGDLVLRTGSGDIVASDLTSQKVDAQAGSGNMSLAFASAPADVDAEAGSGDVRVAVPGAERYAVAVDTGSGDRLVAVDTAADSSRRITVETGSGNASVVPLVGGP